MVIVQDEDEIVRGGSNFIEQNRQNGFSWRWLRRLQHTQHPFSKMWRNRLQSHNEVSQKASGVAIRFVQRQPGGGSFVGGEPCTDQRGFAKTSRGSD